MTEKDTFFLFLSGKGAVIRKEDGVSSYFLLYDSKLAPDRIRQTSLPLDVLHDLLANAKAKEIVVLMDLRDIEYREIGRPRAAPQLPWTGPRRRSWVKTVPVRAR